MAALDRDKNGERTVSIDEATGIQALERKYPGMPVRPGEPEKREFEYIRHGTQTLIASFNVATGKVFGHVGQTRTEEDFVNFLEALVEQETEVTRWHIVTDNLNTHLSESVVRFVAKLSGIDNESLGEKGKTGILKNMATREQFLRNTSHKMVFHFTPKHTSWLNQIEIWFSILVKKVIRRGNFTSKEDLKNKIFDFIDYFNETMAKPFRWTYTGNALQV